MSSLQICAASAPPLPRTLTGLSVSSNWSSGALTAWGDSSPTSRRCPSLGSSKTASGEGDLSQLFDTFGAGAVPMRQPVWWLLRRYQGGARGAKRAQVVQYMSGSCGRFVKGGRQLGSDSFLKRSAPFGCRQNLEICTGRPRPLTCHAASSGRGGDTQVGSSEAEFGGSVLRTVQTIPHWNWFGLRQFSQNVFRGKEVDEGDWRYSPEWWGTQAGGWGRNSGETVFEAPSVTGNGVVSVTSHPASTPTISDPHVTWPQRASGVRATSKHSHLESETEGLSNERFHQLLAYEWRVLRFNSVTRQSVAKVKALATSAGEVVLLQQPNCIAFEYVKSMIAAGLSAVSLAGLDLQRVHSGHQKIRILCVGLGGGSLPLFLAHNLPGATVEVVEIDGAVILAAVKTMGFPPSNGATEDQALLWGDMLERIILHENDGEAFMCEQAREVLAKRAKVEYDLVFVDAFDGEDVVPFKLWDRSGPFLSSLGSLLNANHGTVVVNLHTDSAPPSIIERISGKYGPGFDPTLPQGKRVQEAALAYRDVLLKGSGAGQALGEISDATRNNLVGLAFTVAVSLQGNVSLVVSRLGSAKSELYRALNHQKANIEEGLCQSFVSEAERVQRTLKVSLNMSKRVQRGFRIVKS